MKVAHPTPRLVLVGTIAGLLFGGCQVQPTTTTAPAVGYAIVVPGETVTPTGSHISQVVRKGSRGGVAGDMPGGVTNASFIAHDQMDILPQFPPGR